MCVIASVFFSVLQGEAIVTGEEAEEEAGAAVRVLPRVRTPSLPSSHSVRANPDAPHAGDRSVSGAAALSAALAEFNPDADHEFNAEVRLPHAAFAALALLIIHHNLPPDVCPPLPPPLRHTPDPASPASARAITLPAQPLKVRASGVQ